MNNFNNKFYKKAYSTHGVSAKGVHWNSQRTQYIRFQVITSFIEKKIENSTILDVGCGFAEYVEYLKIKELTPLEYVGIDCEDFMIEESKKRFKEHQFLTCDILRDEIPKKDYLICSGTFNILKKEEFFKAIKNCYESLQKGLIFNFLTKESFNQLKKDEIINFCKELSNKISLSKPYLPNDMTIFLEK